MSHNDSLFQPLYNLSFHSSSNYSLNDIIELAFNETTFASGTSSIHMINFIINSYAETYSSLLTIRDVMNIIKILIDVNIHKKQSHSNESSFFFYSMIESFIQTIIQLQKKDFSSDNSKYNSRYIMEYLINISFMKQSLLSEKNALKNNSIKLLEEYNIILQNYLNKNKSNLYWYSLYPSTENCDNRNYKYNSNPIIIPNKNNSKTNSCGINNKEKERKAKAKVTDEKQLLQKHNKLKCSFTSFNLNLENNVVFSSMIHYNKVLGSSLNYSLLKKEIKSQFRKHEVYILGSMRYGIMNQTSSPEIDLLILPENKQSELLTSFEDYHVKLSQISHNNSTIVLSNLSFHAKLKRLSYSYSVNSNEFKRNGHVTLHIYFYNKILRKTSMIQSELYSFLIFKQLHFYARKKLIEEIHILRSGFELSLLIMHFLDYKYDAFKKELKQNLLSLLSYDIDDEDYSNDIFEAKVKKKQKIISYKELDLLKLDQINKNKPIEELVNEFMNYVYNYLNYIVISTKENKCTESQFMMFENLFTDKKYLLNRLDIDKRITETSISI